MLPCSKKKKEKDPFYNLSDAFSSLAESSLHTLLRRLSPACYVLQSSTTEEAITSAMYLHWGKSSVDASAEF